MEIKQTQLQNKEFRFVRLNGKVPSDKDWTNTRNYPFDAKEISEWQGNIGIVCGYGNLIIIDLEKKEYYEEMKYLLPSTYTIETGNGGVHLYYFCEKTEKVVLEKDG